MAVGGRNGSGGVGHQNERRPGAVDRNAMKAPDEFVKVFNLDTFDDDLARIERLDAMIDRTIKRLMQVKDDEADARPARTETDRPLRNKESSGAGWGTENRFKKKRG